MLKVAKAKEMQEIDRITINRYGIAGTVLMERAGLKVVEIINRLFLQSTVHSLQFTKENKLTAGRRPQSNVNHQPSTVVVLCGGGNNGGDGFVIARLLHNQGRAVKVFLAAKPGNLKGEAKINYLAAKKFGVPIFPISTFLSGHPSRITHHCLTVDALLGTGLSKEVRAPISDVIKKVNRLSCPVISVDIPSGISSDTGQVMGIAVRAECTVTFGLPKRGHVLYPGADHAGRLFIEDIGFPRELLTSRKMQVNLLEDDDIPSLLPDRPRYSHKGTYGHVLLVAGSKGKTGAALMAARACLRSGAGLVTLAVPESLVNIFQSRVMEAMILPLPDRGNGTFASGASEKIIKFLKKRGNVLAIGPGISVDEEISELVRTLIVSAKVPMVIDADGINAIAGKTSVLKKAQAPVILTPHSGEMARLMSSQRLTVNNRQIESDRTGTALTYAKRAGVFLVLKGVPTVTATPGGEVYVNSSGNPGMATAGTGDVLTGMISAFLAQGLLPEKASLLGVYMHGFTGDVVAERKGTFSLIASDIIKAIPSIFTSIQNRSY